MDSNENTQTTNEKQDVVARIKILLEDPEMPAVVKHHFKQELKEPDEPKHYQFYEGAD